MYDDATVTVYQAYSPEIATAALTTGTLVPPFKVDRMTWIKPSFLWMMYRSGWATKPGQERVLAIRVKRSGFDWALRNSCLSAFDPGHHESPEEWRRQLAESPVRIQWDPDKDLQLSPLHQRAIQIGLGGVAARKYVAEWIVSISDRTELAHSVHAMVKDGRASEALALLPKERGYRVSAGIGGRIGLNARPT